MDTEEDRLQHEGESQDSSTVTGQLSCLQCRSRKLKCDRKRPRCERCVKQRETCSYPGSKQRVLGRRKTVRELEERIEELEHLLRNVNLDTALQTGSDASQGIPPSFHNLDLFDMNPLPPHQGLSIGQTPMMNPPVSDVPQGPANQLIDLGLFEQLPSFEIIDELTGLYFQNIHAGAPMLHQASYTAALRLPPHMRPPMCLQYIVMASAAATSETYRHLSEPFYQRARVYAEADELNGQGEAFTTVAHVQSWCLISAYECHIYAMFTRASTSLCRGVRIAQMLKLHQLDNREPEALQIGLPPPRNGIEAEERRRTWWVVFLADRYLTSTTGWPSLIDERHIRTNLPSTDESFATGAAETPVALSKALHELEQGRSTQISSLALRILAANELLHVLDHTSHQSQEDGPDDAQDGPYWRRQRRIEADLNTLIQFLPGRLHLSRNPRNLDAILVHVCTNMATIQLHSTALGVMKRRSLDPRLQARSQACLLPAAEGILAVFRAAGDGVSTAIRNPILSFAAYMAASVFLDDHLQAGAEAPGERGKERSNRQSEDSLHFLARILIFFGRRSPLVRANAFQLAADMKRTGYDASMMDKVMDLFATSGGAASEILMPTSKGSPMVFCPALTSMPFSSDASKFDWLVSSGFQGSGASTSNIQTPLARNFQPGIPGQGGGTVPTMLQAGYPSGLFSQLGDGHVGYTL